MFTKIFISDPLFPFCLHSSVNSQGFERHEDASNFVDAHAQEFVDHLDAADLRGDPLSAMAVLIPESSQLRRIRTSPMLARAQLKAKPILCPQADGSDGSSGFSPGTHMAGQSASLMSRASQPLQVPPFALDIIRSLPVEFQANPVRIVQGVLVRSWLLHHVTFPRSLNPRQAVLRGPPHLWRAQLLQAWFGDNVPQEEISIDLVVPSPPRNWHETHLLFDVILAQGVASGRKSCLVTISPTFQHPAIHMYSTAVSFAQVISGQDVVTDSDIQDLCNLHDCLIFQDQVFLPIDFTRNFPVQPGAGFVVYVNTRQDTAATAIEQPTEVLDPAPEPDQPDAEMTDQVQQGSAASTQHSPAVTASRGLDVTPRRRITLYRLNRVPVVAWVRLSRFSMLLQDILEIMAIPPDELVAVHRIHAKPVGEPKHETSFIVQHQGDVQPGSADQLILLDVAFHQHGSATYPIAPVHFDRRVLRIPSVATRLGLLELARVAQYCEFRHHACIVMIDHVIWQSQHAGVRFLPHGTYGRIHVPPPQVAGAETCRAVSLVETIGDPQPPTFEQVYPLLPTHTSSNMRAEDYDEPPPQDCLGDAICNASGSVHQHRIDDAHHAQPPSFEASTPAQAAPVFPNAPHWHDFELSLRILFEDHSHVELPEEGPVLHVITWFVHHDRSPSCLVGRFIRLSNRPWEWLQQLCMPWLPMLQPFTDLDFHIVRPTPVSHIPGQQAVHVILEQGIQIARRVALFSVLFHGIHGDLTHRRAQSVPTHLSREVIERILNIGEWCRQRRCTACAGRMQFHRSRLEQISQGLGISFTVTPFRNRFAQVDDDGFPIPDTASSSHIPARMSFRPEDASLYPNACWAANDVGPCIEHAPSRLVPELRVIWERYLVTATARPFRFYVETWYCDHDRFPRTDRGREVQLPPDQDSWRDALLTKWQDLIDPSAEVFIYVVNPQPFGGPTDILAHVILAQHQHRGFISSLITTLAPGDDPYDPPRVALKLPAVVDKGLLLQESGLLHFCPPFIPLNTCAAFYGDQPVLQDVLRDAQSGDGFLCTVDPAATVAIGTASYDRHPSHVQWLFQHLATLITAVVTAIDRAVEAQAGWVQSNACLANEISAVQLECIELQREQEACAGTTFAAGDDPVCRRFKTSEVPFSQSTSVKAHNCLRLSDHAGCSRVLLSPEFEAWLGKSVRAAVGPLRVTVWFSDHLRPHDCLGSALAMLDVSDGSWLEVLTQPWLSCIDRGSNLKVLLVQPRGLPLGDASDAHVMLLQNPIPDLASVLFVLQDVAVAPPRIKLSVAVVAEPITPATLAFALHQHRGLGVSALAGDCTFTWGAGPVPPVGPPGVHHAECFGITLSHSVDSWVGLTDTQFAHLLKASFLAPEPVPEPRTGKPVRLSLQVVVPVASDRPSARQFDDALPTISMFEHPDWRARIFDQPLPQLLPLPEGFTIPPATYWALVDDTPLDPDRPSWAELYVDGSTNELSAAWSVVVVRTDGHASHFVGTLFGRVELAVEQDTWIGAQTIDNISAEFTAFAIALDLACRMVPVCSVVRPDLQLSALLAAQQCVTDSNPRLAQLISILAAWLPPDASVHEVRGHSAHPWNDLADAMARWALRHEPGVLHAVDVLHNLVAAAGDLHWSWVQGGPESLFQVLPPIVDQQVCQFPLSLRKVNRDSEVLQPSVDPCRCELKVISLNVLALDSLTQQVHIGRQRGQRTARLDLLWHQEQAHIIGLQEARTLPGRHVTDHFLIFASGFEDSSAPRFGCEIWLHRTRPFVVLPDGSHVCAQDFKFAVVHADPRRLLLRADHPSCSFTVSVLHVPCLGKTKGNGHRPIDDIENWWQETSRIFDGCAPTTYHWVCIDANAPLASQATPCFDLAHAEPTNPQGTLFEDFLLRHSLAVPATFSHLHSGDSWTWTHSSGARCRRDYVLVPVSLLPCVQDSFTVASYDGSFCHEDHIPTGVHFAAYLPSATSKRRLLWDEMAFLDPSNIAQFQDALRTLPLPTWDVKVTDHCHIFED